VGDKSCGKKEKREERLLCSRGDKHRFSKSGTTEAREGTKKEGTILKPKEPLRGFVVFDFKRLLQQGGTSDIGMKENDSRKKDWCSAGRNYGTAELGS